MSFADEIRSQTKSKEEIEAAAEAERQTVRRARARGLEEKCAHLRKAVKDSITGMARNGKYRSIGTKRLIEGAWTEEWMLSSTMLSSAEKWAVGEMGRQARWGLIFSGCEIHTQAFHPENFRKIYNQMMDDFRRDGIEVDLTIKCGFGMCHYYEFPMEKVIEGYTTCIKTDLSYESAHKEKQLICKYRFLY